jgi:signal transduction histidine kinase
MADDASTANPVRVKGQPTSSLRRKLLVFSALLVLVPGVALTALAERSARRALEEVIGRQLSREAGHTAERLSVLLRSELASLRSFARQDLMRELRVLDVDKRVAVALATLRDGSPLRLDYLALSSAGDVVTASRAALVGPPPHWLETSGLRPGSDGRVTGPLALPGRGTEALVLMAPIPDPDDPGRVLGALVGLLDWGRLTALTEDVRRDLAAQGVAADVVVSRPDGSVIGGARSAGVSEEWIAGEAWLAPELPQWNVVVREPRSHALASVRRLSRRLAVTMGLALAGALLLATLAARRVVRPLGQLTAGIREIAHGKPGRAPVPVRGADEIGVLASSFNDMASRLDRTQRDLVEAEKFAFVGELAAGVAHEIRTSLGVLASSAQILERSLPAGASAESAELAQMVRAEVARLGGVVNDLLNLRGRPLRLEAVAVSEVLGRAVEFVSPQAREKGVRVAFTPLAADPPLRGDPELIQQVAVNLLVNAVQAVPVGGRVEARALPAATGEGGFEIEDDGPGISPELRERVFEPFVTARPGGVGLGLTFVKRVVHEHHGSVRVDPALPTGTRVRILFPLAEGTS